MRGIERRQANQALRADLGAQVAIGVTSRDLDGHAFKASLFTLAIVVDLGAELVPFSPAQVHTKEHLGPVLRIDAAAARVNTDDGVAFVMFAVEHQREEQLFSLLFKCG